MPFLVLVAGVALALWAASALRPGGLWVVAMVGSEVSGWLAITSAGILIGYGRAGWSGGYAGAVGQVLLLFATVGFTVAALRALRASGAAERALEALPSDAPIRWRARRGLLLPISRAPRRMIIDEGVSYGPHPRHLVDHMRVPAPGPRPVLIHVHGGGWWRGRRNTQARPLVHRMVRSGWSVFTPSYRLSPEATHPDHLVDVKRAIAWIRDEADALGVDPGMVAVAGGSTGGNLAALAALTQGRADLQPGFEQADTSVQACIPLYGVHDLLSPSGQPLWPYLATTVMKSRPEDEPDAWASASPIRMASPEHPPFLVVHGTADGVVPARLSRELVEALRAVDGSGVIHLELRWANHGFDFFAGPRGRVVAELVARMLDAVRARVDG